jgi:Conserved hypothetical protein (DUF2461)
MTENGSQRTASATSARSANPSSPSSPTSPSRCPRVSPYVVADPRPVGGSLFRIHRDTRFSKDKTPHKTLGAWFRHRGGKHDRGPGFYLHLEPGRVFGGAGIWHPEPPTLQRLRTAVAKRGPEWKKALGGAIRRTCTLEGDALVRPPRGFPPDHPLIEDLKRNVLPNHDAFHALPGQGPRPEVLSRGPMTRGADVETRRILDRYKRLILL